MRPWIVKAQKKKTAQYTCEHYQIQVWIPIIVAQIDESGKQWSFARSQERCSQAASPSSKRYPSDIWQSTTHAILEVLK
jgi:hypothetical protein